MATAPFYQSVASAVQAATRGTPFFPSVVLAQLGVESKQGQSLLSSKYHNYLGHKAGSKWKGPTVRFKTPNDADKVSTFRVYGSLRQCLAAHIVVLRSALYRRAQLAATPAAQIQALASIYAEDPRYATSLAAVVRQNNLTQFDAPTDSAGWLALGLLASIAAYRYRNELRRTLHLY